MDVGLDNVIAAARDLGVTEPLPHVPSLALGSVGVSLLELTGAFASVRADRMHERPWGVAAVGTENGSRMLAMLPPIRPAQNLYADGRRLTQAELHRAGSVAPPQCFRVAGYPPPEPRLRRKARPIGPATQ
jgi:membrane peptidoglycan carboxypeptidase